MTRRIFKKMNPRPKHNLIEWGFVLAMVVLCATLAALQWRWTGAVAEAETARLQGNLDEQARRLAQAFDAELSAGCAQLTPSRAELESRGREAAHLARLHEWSASKPHPIFSRIAFGVSTETAVQLTKLDPTTGTASPMDWPVEWTALRDNLSAKRSGGWSPYEDETGRLIEFPIFGGRRRGGPGGPPGPGGSGESWLIFEIDAAFLRATWLPALVREHLNLDGGPLYDVVVRSRGAQIFATSAESTGSTAKPVSITFNRGGRGAMRRDAEFDGPPDIPGGPRGGSWMLEVRRHPGALEAIVSAARWRNLAVAGAVNGLILAAGLALVRHTRRSRALAEAQMNFVATVSHELRTPLTVIRGAAHNLERGVVQEPERVAQYAGLITQHAGQLQGMVEQVLEFAGAKKNPVRAPVALDEVLREAIAAAEPDTQAARCELAIEIPATLPMVTGDAAALRRAFQNLIANAAKHGGAGGWIGITAEATNGTSPPAIEVHIDDRGPGIPENERAEIFQPFVRGAAAQAAQIRGSGLGLSLVREIVEAHGGKISVRTDGGAIFTVKLPVNEI